MGLPLLQLTLNFGKLIGIIPLYKSIFFGKFYATNLTIFLLLGSAVSIAYRASFYSQLRHFKLIFNLLIDLVVCLFDIATITASNFWYREKLLKLIKKLKSNNPPIVNKKKNSYYLEFFLVQLVMVSITIHEFYAWTKALGDENYKQYTVYYIQLYLQYYHTFLMSVIIRLIATKYQFLNHLIVQQIKFANQRKTTTSNFVVFTKTIENQLYSLKEIIDFFNDIFGYPIFFLVFYFAVMLQDCLDDVSRNNFGYSINNVFDITISNISILLIFAICTIGLTELCYKVLVEANKTWRLCVRLQRHFESRERLEWLEMENLIDFLAVHPPKFSAAGVFEMTRNTILSIISLLLGYLIVFIQFESDKIWQ